jgi:phosphate-selective porin
MKNIIWFTGMLLLLSPFSLSGQGCAEPSSDEGVKVWGYMQPEMNVKFTDKTQASFLLRRMRLGVMGNIPYDFSYYFLVETSQFINPDRTGAFLLDGFITYKRFRFFKISLGSFKNQFGRELVMPCHALYTVNRSKFVDELTSGLNGSNRDIGVAFMGGNDTTFLTYTVTVTNGTGALAVDNNLFDTYALTGRMTIQPIKKLYFGVSARHIESPPTAEGVTDKDTKLRYGFDAQYSIGGFTFLGEYIHGTDEGSYLEGGGCGGDPVLKTGTNNADGYYIMGVYRFPFNLEPVYKFESYTTKKDDGGDTPNPVENTSYYQTFGLNYYPNDWSRIQVNYVYRAERPTEHNDDCLFIQVQVKF